MPSMPKFSLRAGLFRKGSGSPSKLAKVFEAITCSKLRNRNKVGTTSPKLPTTTLQPTPTTASSVSVASTSSEALTTSGKLRFGKRLSWSAECIKIDVQSELIKIHDLYALAMDEVSFYANNYVI